MRVSIKFDEQRGGLFRNRTDIYLIISIEFSDEEKAIIRQRSWEKHHIIALSLLSPKPESPRINPFPLTAQLPVVGRFFERLLPSATFTDVLVHKTFIYKFEGVAQAQKLADELRAELVLWKNDFNSERNIGEDVIFDL